MNFRMVLCMDKELNRRRPKKSTISCAKFLSPEQRADLSPSVESEQKNKESI